MQPENPEASRPQPVLVTVREAGAGDERLDDLSRLLQDELAGHDLDVRPARGGGAPPGTRGIDVATVGALVVAAKGSVDIVTTIVSAVRAWLGRGSTPTRSVELTVGGNTLRIDAASEDEQRELVAEFLRAVRQG